MTMCNYCTLKGLRKKGFRIIKRHATWGMGGHEIYRVPIGEKLDKEKHHVAWLMEIPDHCVC